MASRRSSESDPKGGESESSEDKVTRGNFEALAKGLFRVTPEQYAAEEKRQEMAGSRQPRKKRP
jgi:hypothetical protein